MSRAKNPKYESMSLEELKANMETVSYTHLEQEEDFISCVTFGKSAEFAQKYLHKGMRIVIGGRISTVSYTHLDVYKRQVLLLQRPKMVSWPEPVTSSLLPDWLEL